MRARCSRDLTVPTGTFRHFRDLLVGESLHVGEQHHPANPRVEPAESVGEDRSQFHGLGDPVRAVPFRGDRLEIRSFTVLLRDRPLHFPPRCGFPLADAVQATVRGDPEKPGRQGRIPSESVRVSGMPKGKTSCDMSKASSRSDSIRAQKAYTRPGAPARSRRRRRAFPSGTPPRAGRPARLPLAAFPRRLPLLPTRYPLFGSNILTRFRKIAAYPLLCDILFLQGNSSISHAPYPSGGGPWIPCRSLYIAPSVSVLILAIGVSIALARDSAERGATHAEARRDPAPGRNDHRGPAEDEHRRPGASFPGSTLRFPTWRTSPRGSGRCGDPSTWRLKVLDHSVSPALVGFAGGIAGIKAAASHILHRFTGKEGIR